MKRGIWLVLVIFIITGCSDTYKMSKQTEDELTDLQLEVLEFIVEDGHFGTNGCWSNINEEGIATMYIDAYEEENIDYEAYKERIWEAVDTVFNIEFVMIPYPTEPVITGVVRRLDGTNYRDIEGFLGNILVVAQESDRIAGDGYPYYDAVTITVDHSCEIVDEAGNTFSFSDIKPGMEVSSYYRGMTFDTYPGQQGSEKIVVNRNYKRPMLSDALNQDMLEAIYEGNDYTGPYPVVVEGYRYEMTLEESAIDIVFYMQSGMVYYEADSTLSEPTLYEGTLDITVIGPGDMYALSKIENVMIKPDEPIHLTQTEEGTFFEVPQRLITRELVTFKLTDSGEVIKVD